MGIWAFGSLEACPLSEIRMTEAIARLRLANRGTGEQAIARLRLSAQSIYKFKKK
jgi:hypothetical protein